MDKKGLNTNLSSFQLAHKTANIADEAKGIDVVMLDVSTVFNLADYFIVASGKSDRHVQGICNRILAELSEKYKLEPLAIEGYEKAHWILMDYGDVIIHIFYEQERNHYSIESLWMEAVRVNWKNKQRKREKVAA
jgi:ribosome-associated protein